VASMCSPCRVTATTGLIGDRIRNRALRSSTRPTSTVANLTTIMFAEHIYRCYLAN